LFEFFLNFERRVGWFQVGRLWTSLADYYIRRALFEKSRDVYEEGMTSVTTVRDFSTIFDAYMQFEESMLSAKMEQVADEMDDEEPEDEDEVHVYPRTGFFP
jgi:pre-mRNA-splicing factor SYF1